MSSVLTYIIECKWELVYQYLEIHSSGCSCYEHNKQIRVCVNNNYAGALLCCSYVQCSLFDICGKTMIYNFISYVIGSGQATACDT